MKKQIAFCILFFAFLFGKTQTNVGDTVVIKSFKYGSNSRDTLINFPNASQTYEKIIMKYNMRCKNGLISNQNAPNQGCGEWDYSCNTYIVDSTKIELNPKTHPNTLISNFTGTAFPYVNTPIYDYYDFMQTNVVLNSVVSETLYPVGNGTASVTGVLKSNERSGRSLVLVTASELTAAGLTAGPIHGFFLNVANAGGGTNFLRVKLRMTSATNTVLSASAPTLTGFTEVYNKNYTFTTGSNRILFNTPFNWDGTSNIIIDLSFTNTQASTPVILNGTSTMGNTVMFANNNYAIDLGSNGHATINSASLTSISNEITITLWAYGTVSLLPANTTVLYGWSNDPNQRQINIHFPWSDNNVYFDAGYVSGGFDRINKAALTSETEGQWNHWAFTKNAATGSMKIYLNGTLWHSGTSKTKVMSLLNLILGKDNSLNNNYKGKVNELTIWNKELAANDIQAYVNRSIDASHPFYSNLVAYYKLNEGSGMNLADSKFALNSTGANLHWTYDRGDKLSRMFNDSNVRPNLNFFRGTYSTTTNTLTVRDSVLRQANVVTTYSITNNATVVPMAHDAVVLTSTSYSYQALPKNVFDGDNNVLTSTLAVVPDGTLIISNLNYVERYPFYNEIMSFVTPYGKGLDLGINGKSWYFDVTDFAPLLQGPKRMVMTLGGQYQEQMDVDFYFIIGTPPRNVLQFNQLWQGAARDGGASIGSINNNTRFAPLSVPLLSNGQYFKVRSTITGHGAEGEFHQNGGTVTHSFNVNGGANEFAWYITQDCSTNPVYPQGGTWLYDRQGWCPGEVSLLKQNNITPFVTPGSTVTLDYNCSTPMVSSGDYRYIEAHQLITYGGANFSTDASILDVLQPSNKVLYSRKNPMCDNPKVLVQNTGSTTLTSMVIDYWLNATTTKQTYTWTGTLAFMDTVTIKLPVATLWINGLQPTGNVFHAEIKKVNNVTDDYSYNNKYHSEFTKPDQVPDYFLIEIRTNNNYVNNDYKLYDDNGNVVGASTFTANNTVFKDYYLLNGCFRLVINDYGKDGLSWWANSGQGTGYARVKDGFGNTIKIINPDFGSFVEYSFSTYPTTSITEQHYNISVSVYPNPSKDKFTLSGSGLEFSQIVVTDVLGKEISKQSIGNETKYTYDASSLTPGMYFITVQRNGCCVS